MKFPLTLLIPLLCVVSPMRPGLFPGDAPSAPAPRNIILMIGDGMGLAHLSAARHQKGRLAVEEMPCLGLSFTHSLKDFVTDSSASATALATGYLIVNGQVGIHPDGSRVKTILEYAEEKGMWTGVVVTSRVTHATPACMMAHVKDRGMEDEIAVQMAFAGIEVILGGGWDKFLPARKLKVDFDGAGSSPEGPPLAAGAAPTSRAFLASAAELAAGAAAGGTTTLIEAPRPLVGADGKPYGNRTDGRDLIAAMERQGYTFARSPAELSLVTGGAPRKVLGLFHSGPMPRVSEGRSPSLSAMALAALRVLSQSPQGFFLMIEGSQIDWGAHANDFNYAVLEAADFDDTLEAVRGFLEAKGIAGETLIVLTADHETGGLTLNKHPQLPLGLEPKWTTTYHTGAPVPVFSCGAGAASFGGFQNHAAIGRKLIQCLLGRKVEFPEPAAAPPAKERL